MLGGIAHSTQNEGFWIPDMHQNVEYVECITVPQELIILYYFIVERSYFIHETHDSLIMGAQSHFEASIKII